MIKKIPDISFNRFNKNAKNSMSFGSIERMVFDENNGYKIKYCNDTRLFRDDLNWNMVADHIIQKGTPQKIYCYACSDGSEPYSIAMALISKLGYAEAQKYFPIIARDVDSRMLDIAQKGIIDLDVNDLRRLREYKMPVDFINENNPIGYHKDKKVFNVSSAIRDCVEFQRGDLIKDAETLDFSNCTLFFRNVWPYLSDSDVKKLINTLSKRFGEKSSLIVGSFDHLYNSNTLSEFFMLYHYVMTKPQIFTLSKKVASQADIMETFEIQPVKKSETPRIDTESKTISFGSKNSSKKRFFNANFYRKDLKY